MKVLDKQGFECLLPKIGGGWASLGSALTCITMSRGVLPGAWLEGTAEIRVENEQKKGTKMVKVAGASFLPYPTDQNTRG
jgi:hypothetical protein